MLHYAIRNVIHTIFLQYILMRNDEKQVNKNWQSLFNVKKLLFQDMESILARLYGPSQAWLQYVHCQTQKYEYF